MNNTAYMREYCRSHPEYRKECSARQISKRKLFRAAVFEKLGSKCVRCGFLDVRALQIDHINGDGYKEGNRGYTYVRLRNILNDPQIFLKYQLLCANCNWIKREENKEYKCIYTHDKPN